MNPAEFIRVNIVRALEKEGYPPHEASLGADIGLRHYHRGTFKKGEVFNECLRHAKTILLKKRSPKR